ncbi:MAG: SDR family NAD(P)-dependent oxidoreductase [Patescibacteria group bacterium]|nr:SDR family NAD(P)-dependent oxidoreductase [Patescibacteria group bacterium]
MKPNALVVGGSSGLGLELARLLRDDYNVIITGRQDPKEENMQFRRLELGSIDDVQLFEDLNFLANSSPSIHLLIYAAGFYQEGRVDELTAQDIISAFQVGLVAPTMLLGRLLQGGQKLTGFIAITSTSQWTPRELEPVYAAAKAGLGMLAQSVSLDPRVHKVLVVGPAGMNTRFWRETKRDMSILLDPRWVAEQTLELYRGNFNYQLARVLREPPRVEVVETR